MQKKQKEAKRSNRKHKLTIFGGGRPPPTPHSPPHQQGTKDVRLDPQLNKKVWESGIKGVPFRLRVRISRKRNDEEGAKEKLYSFVQAVNVKEPKGLQTSVNDDA
ncbi:60S ribosomal protein [Histoplasma capsulatum var. duboisii H88]|uniref:60S ribosomal protein n=1 Tax=Ajellomyces capsulatus (strain H88) TaxID=544711 RepID=F0UV13_AJEC8|nr:60S ribosomal protein [Histoplasma capsulatum var. duboisii H88]